MRSLDDVHGTTVLVGVCALAVILGLRRVAPAVPGALVLVAGGMLAAALFDLGEHGVALVGEVPSGLPAPELPDLALVGDHAATVGIAAVALLLIGFSQTAGDARAFAARHRYRIDVNQESVGQGMANVGAGVFQGMPVSTSLSASSLNESSGARTPLASLVTGALVIATLLVLAPLFSDLPKAVLGAVIIDAVVFGMIDVRELRRLYRVTRFDFWVASGGDRRRALRGRAGGRRDRRRALAHVARLRLDEAADAAAGPRGGDRRVPRPRREPRRRDVPGDRHPAASTVRSSSRPPRRSRIASASWPKATAPIARSCWTSKGSTSSTRRARRS